MGCVVSYFGSDVADANALAVNDIKMEVKKTASHTEKQRFYYRRLHVMVPRSVFIPWRTTSDYDIYFNIHGFSTHATDILIPPTGSNSIVELKYKNMKEIVLTDVFMSGTKNYHVCFFLEQSFRHAGIYTMTGNVEALVGLSSDVDVEISMYYGDGDRYTHGKPFLLVPPTRLKANTPFYFGDSFSITGVHYWHCENIIPAFLLYMQYIYVRVSAPCTLIYHAIDVLLKNNKNLVMEFKLPIKFSVGKNVCVIDKDENVWYDCDTFNEMPGKRRDYCSLSYTEPGELHFPSNFIPISDQESIEAIEKMDAEHR